MLALIPLFGGSNWFYTYQFQVYNGGGYFNIRARALNNLIYWISQIIGAIIFGFVVDSKQLGSRRARAFFGLLLVFIITSATWIGAIFVQLKFTAESVKILKNDTSLQQDVYSRDYAGEAITYALFGSVDAMYQGFCYWLMGALTNDTKKSARFGAFYKTVQNMFSAIAPQLDVAGISFLVQLIVSWAFCVVGMACAIPVAFHVRESEETTEADEKDKEKEDEYEDSGQPEVV